jgi:hypothetical protein
MAKKELDPDLGEAGTISSSMGDINYQYDESNDNYIVDISLTKPSITPHLIPFCST